MTDPLTLTALLDGTPEAAVHRVAATVTPASVERAALDAGWRFALVESDDDADKPAVMASFQRGLGLPDWFGHNLDALVDALRDLGAGAQSDGDEPSGTVIMWDRTDAFAAAHDGDYRAVLDILAQRSGDADRPRVVTLVRTGPTEA